MDTKVKLSTLMMGELDLELKNTRPSDEREVHMKEIHKMAETGEIILEPMRSANIHNYWDDITFKAAQLAKMPLKNDAKVNLTTVIGPKAKKPLKIELPYFVTHMSYGALSLETKVALAKGSSAVKTAIGSGEGGILEDSRKIAYRYIFEYVPNRYSITDKNLKQVHAIEFKIGQATSPGQGARLPGSKVTPEIAKIRGYEPSEDIVSPPGFLDLNTKEKLKEEVSMLRRKSGGVPIGIKIAANDIEADMKIALYAKPDFITIDGRGGATGAAVKNIKDNVSIPSLFAIYRARKFLGKKKANYVSLIATGGFRTSMDIAKGLAMGADAIALGTASLMAVGCQQYRICHTGLCPMGITTQKPNLRKLLNPEVAAKRLENFYNVIAEELRILLRSMGKKNIHNLKPSNMLTTNSEISNYTNIKHV